MSKCPTLNLSSFTDLFWWIHISLTCRDSQSQLLREYTVNKTKTKTTRFYCDDISAALHRMYLKKLHNSFYIWFLFIVWGINLHFHIETSPENLVTINVNQQNVWALLQYTCSFCCQQMNMKPKALFPLCLWPSHKFSDSA